MATNIRQNSRIANSFGDKAPSSISGADVGALAANLLIDTNVVKEGILITGGVGRLIYDEVASTISADASKTVRYEELTLDGWRAELISASKAKGGEVISEVSIISWHNRLRYGLLKPFPLQITSAR